MAVVGGSGPVQVGFGPNSIGRKGERAVTDDNSVKKLRAPRPSQVRVDPGVMKTILIQDIFFSPLLFRASTSRGKWTEPGFLTKTIPTGHYLFIKERNGPERLYRKLFYADMYLLWYGG